ncbi:hypothetical protein ACGYLO_12070 [Sulfitobacter sp. 1A13353]|uniref:hypothetical protein n=1 Tax=Sulfitobacter sp. 1A13353 TaxID=3368568 RepID=UPI0037477770
MVTILEEVSNFAQYPDGRLRVGPFLTGPEEIARLLARYGLHLGASNERGVCSTTMLGVMISCAGEGVKGYFLDEEGLEAPSSDVEDFLIEAVGPGTNFIIEGHHCPDQQSMVRSSMNAWQSEGDLVVSTQRALFTRDGERVTMLNQAPVSITSPSIIAGNTPPLCLVG